jgi:hypothetical protein
VWLGAGVQLSGYILILGIIFYTPRGLTLGEGSGGVDELEVSGSFCKLIWLKFSFLAMFCSWVLFA